MNTPETTQTPKLIKLSESDRVLKDKAEDVRNRKVIDKDQKEMGSVNDIIIDDSEHKVRFLEVGAGGFLGIGEKTFLIPVDAITRIDEEHVHINQTTKKVMDAPEYDPKLAYEQDNHETWTNTYRWYGYPGFWTRGYRYPGYPYF